MPNEDTPSTTKKRTRSKAPPAKSSKAKGKQKATDDDAFMNGPEEGEGEEDEEEVAPNAKRARKNTNDHEVHEEVEEAAGAKKPRKKPTKKTVEECPRCAQMLEETVGRMVGAVQHHDIKRLEAKLEETTKAFQATDARLVESQKEVENLTAERNELKAKLKANRTAAASVPPSSNIPDPRMPLSPRRLAENGSRYPASLQNPPTEAQPLQFVQYQTPASVFMPAQNQQQMFHQQPAAPSFLQPSAASFIPVPPQQLFMQLQPHAPHQLQSSITQQQVQFSSSSTARPPQQQQSEHQRGEDQVAVGENGLVAAMEE
ncbi:hypothetical protein K438DRAFT_1764365 [Mycena galopus ATCC 62051]|nr:hypothetical protein K438DRAFT_1764365 [Mycena galopus ATCC 62051]